MALDMEDDKVADNDVYDMIRQNKKEKKLKINKQDGS